MVDFNNVADVGVGALDFFFDVFLYVAIGLVFAGMIGLFLFMSKYNKRVVIRKKINGKNKIFYDKARKIEKDGIIWWKLFKAKKMIEVPPNEAVEVDGKGRDFIELYELETGEFIPMVDNHNKINAIEPFTTNQRQLLQGQYIKATLERGFKFTDFLGAITYVAGLVILVISLLVFYGDIAKPVLEMGDKQAAIADKQIEFQKQMNIMIEKLNSYQESLDKPEGVSGDSGVDLNRGAPN